MLYFPDEGHWILKPQNSKLWYETVGDWCDRWTKTNAYAAVGFDAPAARVAVAKASDGRVGQSRPAEMEETQQLPEPAPAAKTTERAVTPPAKRAAPVERVPAAAAEKPSQSGDGRATFLLAISAPNDEAQVWSDVRIVITLRNLAPHQILFGHRPGTENAEFSYSITVRNAAGRTVEETAYGRDTRLHQQTEGRTVDYVQPGQSVVQTAHLGRLVNLGRVGEYKVKVSRKDPETQTVVQSNEITLNVIP